MKSPLIFFFLYTLWGPSICGPGGESCPCICLRLDEEDVATDDMHVHWRRRVRQQLDIVENMSTAQLEASTCAIDLPNGCLFFDFVFVLCCFFHLSYMCLLASVGGKNADQAVDALVVSSTARIKPDVFRCVLW